MQVQQNNVIAVTRSDTGYEALTWLMKLVLSKKAKLHQDRDMYGVITVTGEGVAVVCDGYMAVKHAGIPDGIPVGTYYVNYMIDGGGKYKPVVLTTHTEPVSKYVDNVLGTMNIESWKELESVNLADGNDSTPYINSVCTWLRTHHYCINPQQLTTLPKLKYAVGVAEYGKYGLFMRLENSAYGIRVIIKASVNKIVNSEPADDEPF